MEKDKKTLLKNEKGMSLFESLPLILVLASLIGFLLGLWGMTHKSILHSIAARNYAFQKLNHRANLTYFDDSNNTDNVKHSFLETGLRFFAIGSSGSDKKLYAFSTPMRFPAKELVNEPAQLHIKRIWESGKVPVGAETTLGTKEPWIMVAYGICLNSNCGG